MLNKKSKLAIIHGGTNQGGFAGMLHEQGQNVYTALGKGLSSSARFSQRWEQNISADVT